MKTYTFEELKTILAEHAKWSKGEGGSRAVLRGSNLSGSNLSGSNLRGSDLRGSVLRYSNLRGSVLSYSNLRGSDLRGSDLRGSNLSGSDLSYSDLRGSNLRGSVLRGSVLSGVKNLPAFQICEGDLIVYKKVAGKIITLAIPKAAKRTASIVGRKCRAEYALVLDIEGHQPVTSTGCGNVISTSYEEGKEVRPDSYDDDFRVECSHGIHFFLTRQEAEKWNS